MRNREGRWEKLAEVSPNGDELGGKEAQGWMERKKLWEKRRRGERVE